MHRLLARATSIARPSLAFFHCSTSPLCCRLLSSRSAPPGPGGGSDPDPTSSSRPPPPSPPSGIHASSEVAMSLASYRSALREAVEGGGQGITAVVTMFERLDRGVVPGLAPDDAMVEEVINLCVAHMHTRPLLPTLRRWLPRGLHMAPETYLAATQALCRKQRTLDVVAFLALLRKYHVKGRDKCYAVAVEMVTDQMTRLRILTEWVEDEDIAADDTLLCAVLQELTDWQRWGPNTSVKEIVATLAAEGGVDSKHVKKSLALGLKYFGNHGMWKEALVALQTMLKRGDQLDLHLATSALVACARAGEKDACEWLLQRMMEEGLPIDDRVLTAMVMLPGQRRDWEGVIGALRAFEENGISRTTWATSVAIKGLGHSGAWPIALWVYEEAGYNGVEVDQPMVRSLMEALPRTGQGVGVDTITEAIAAPVIHQVITNNLFRVWKRPWVADLHKLSVRMARLTLPVILEQAAMRQEEQEASILDLHIITGWGRSRSSMGRTEQSRSDNGGGHGGLTGQEVREGLKEMVQEYIQKEVVQPVEWLDRGTMRVKARDLKQWWDREKMKRPVDLGKVVVR